MCPSPRERGEGAGRRMRGGRGRNIQSTPIQPAQSPAVVFKDHSGEAHAYADPLWNLIMWLRICVAFGVFSGLPVPTGDPLASLHIGLRRCLDGSTEPGMAAGGRLDREKVTRLPCISPLSPLPHVTVRTKAPASTCPRTSRATLRRRKQGDCRHGFGGRG